MAGARRHGTIQRAARHKPRRTVLKAFSKRNSSGLRAMTGEKALPVLQAAHIRPVSEGGVHRIDNGLLLRSDVHTLFDRGYVSVGSDFRVRVSRRLKTDFDNGEQYFRLRGDPLHLPRREIERPAREFLEWHGDVVFRG